MLNDKTLCKIIQTPILIVLFGIETIYPEMGFLTAVNIHKHKCGLKLYKIYTDSYFEAFKYVDKYLFDEMEPSDVSIFNHKSHRLEQVVKILEMQLRK